MLRLNRWLPNLVIRWFPWLRRRRADVEIQKELDLHLELETKQNLERGMSRKCDAD